jgi:hypothetical protein
MSINQGYDPRVGKHRKTVEESLTDLTVKIAVIEKHLENMMLTESQIEKDQTKILNLLEIKPAVRLEFRLGNPIKQ